MQHRPFVIMGLLAMAGALKGPALPRSYGPGGCVSVVRSRAGSCVVSTDCAGVDLSDFDFSFDCADTSDGHEMHTLGAGSFDEVEAYDTGVKCAQCLPPTSAAVPAVVSAPSTTQALLAGANSTMEVAPAKPTAFLAGRHTGATPNVSLATSATQVIVANNKTMQNAGAGQVEHEETKAQHYGPSGCVSTWLDKPTGACVMRTACDSAEDLSIYEFGLVCLGNDDELTRHLFGMDSFAHKETFNTGIKCKRCLSLDEYMDSSKALMTLAKEVQGIQGDLTYNNKKIGRLTNKVFPSDANIKMLADNNGAKSSGRDQQNMLAQRSPSSGARGKHSAHRRHEEVSQQTLRVQDKDQDADDNQDADSSGDDGDADAGDDEDGF